MRDPDVYVRARNGALYRNPLFMPAEGVVGFPPNAVEGVAALWIKTDGAEQVLEPTPLLDGIFGKGCWAICGGTTATLVHDHPIPGSDETRPALVFRFALTRRIPTPPINGGTEKHASRIQAPDLLVDLPPHPDDLYGVPI